MTPPDTNVIRTLTAHNVAFTLLPHSKQVFTVAELGEERGVVDDEIIKSILLRDKDYRYVLACTLGNDRLNPKAVRALMPDRFRRLTFADDAQVLEITGYPRGAVAPIGIATDIPIVFDERILTRDKVNTSTGDLLFGIELRRVDLIAVVQPMIASISTIPV